MEFIQAAANAFGRFVDLCTWAAIYGIIGITVAGLFLFVVLHGMDAIQAAQYNRKMEARRRALRHGATMGWDCPRPRPFIQIQPAREKDGTNAR